MTFKLTVAMDNAAFDDSQEIPRILRDLAERISEEPQCGDYIIRDVNGNRVGVAKCVGRIRKAA